MDRFCKMLFLPVCLLFVGHAAAQSNAVPRINPIQLKNPAQAANPVAMPRLAPGVVIPLDAEAQVQAEIKRQKKKHDDISSALAKVGANYSRLNSTPSTGNACIDPNTTWNARSGESFSCLGQTTCNARAARWSKNRSNPCEAGLAIDSCITSEECKAGSLCDTGPQKCVPR